MCTATLDTINDSITISNTHLDNIHSLLTDIKTQNTNLIANQEQQIFILNSVVIGCGFLVGFFMWYLTKKNFFNFGV